MTAATFWKLIDRTRLKVGGDVKRQAAALVEVLAHLPIKEIFSFEKHFGRYSRKAYDWRLHAAGSILAELEMGDDDFSDFISWLISRGKAAYVRVLQDPETLTEIAEPGERVTCEEMGNVGGRAYTKKTGRDFFDLPGRPAPDPEIKNADLVWTTPEGHADEDRLRVLFPRLWARFGSRF